MRLADRARGGHVPVILRSNFRHLAFLFRLFDLAAVLGSDRRLLEFVENPEALVGIGLAVCWQGVDLGVERHVVLLENELHVLQTWMGRPALGQSFDKVPCHKGTLRIYRK
ncbi:hypothetical protein D3C72_1267740 [compost metagenome]